MSNDQKIKEAFQKVKSELMMLDEKLTFSYQESQQHRQGVHDYLNYLIKNQNNMSKVIVVLQQKVQQLEQANAFLRQQIPAQKQSETVESWLYR